MSDDNAGTCRYCGEELHVVYKHLLTQRGRPSTRTVPTFHDRHGRSECRTASGAPTLHQPARRPIEAAT